MSTDDPGETERKQGLDAANVADRTGSRLERMGLGRTTGGVVLVTAGILVLAQPELLTLVVGVGCIVLGVLVLASADDHIDL